jgi:peptidoglycan/LPS O-acetylase OafA/YrhL
VAIIINSLISGKGGIFSLVLNIPPLVWVGRISYSLYLWQQLFAPFPGTEPLWFTKFPVNLILSFFLATLSYYCLELPLLRLRKKSLPDSFPHPISVV